MYILERGAAGWAIESSIPQPDGVNSGSRFGYGLAASRNHVVVGAPAADVEGVRAVGAAFVFERAGSEWSLAGRLGNPNPSPRSFFGESVGFEDGVAVVGSEAVDRGRGAVLTFEQRAGAWAATSTLVVEGAPPSSSFGSRLALSGGTLLVGAPYDGGGAAFAYVRTSEGWAPR